MKIAYFIGTLKKEDGVTRVLLALIREAQKKEFGSVIVTGWAEDASISPAPVIQVPSIIFPLYKEYRLSLPGIRGFSRQLDEFQPDIIHLHSPDTIAWSALKYAKKRKVPIMATYHTDFGRYLAYYHLSFLRPAVWIALKRLYKQMRFVTTPSQVISDELIGHGIPNVQTIPWGVEFARFDISFRSPEWRQKILKDGQKTILLCVCRLTWEKDLRTLAQTYNLLKKNRSDFAMVIAGDGPAKKELQSLMPGAIFLGHLEGLEFSKVYASCDIFLFPSTTETFGNVTVEAMASGLVPVVADAGGSKTLVRDGENGFLARPKNSDDFCKKVSRLLDDQPLRGRMRNAGLDFVKNFTWEKVFDSLLKIYSNCLPDKK
jgi:phosphatidylinositol alpha 1,6-mannosyltransferase